MSQITQGNRLYLYQMLSRELGQSRQTMLSQVEEVLATDDILPCDLGCESVRELVGELGEFCRLTVFKRGRVYVTILPNPDYDAQIAASLVEKAPQQKRAGGRKSFKQKRAQKQVRPAKPRPRNRVVEEPSPLTDAPDMVEVAQPAPAVAPETVDEQLPVDATEETGTQADSSEGDASQVSAAPKTEPAEVRPEQASAPAMESSPQEAPKPSEAAVGETPADATCEATEPAPDDAAFEVAQDEGAKIAQGTDTSAGVSVPTADETAPLAEDGATLAGDEADDSPTEALQVDGALSRLQVVFMPPESEEGLTDDAFHESQKAPVVAVLESVPPRESIFPDRFATHVWCTDEALADLYAILPFDVDPWAMLDEDWRFARSTDDYSYEGGVLTFPLHYLRTDGEPVKVALRRVAGTSGGRRWRLETVECGEEVGVWGLPTADEGVWSHLADSWHQPRELVSPRRELCHFAHIGSIDALTEDLSGLALDEDWGQGAASLIDYLAVTFKRVMAQGRLRISADGRTCAFDTGLLTDDLKPISMRFAHAEGTFAWAFEGFVPETSESALKPATYVSDFSHMTLDITREVTLAEDVAQAHGDGFDKKVRGAVALTARNHRVATPAYDPQTDEVHLLLPIECEGVTHALVLKDERERYVASSVLPTTVAYPYARVVSSEQPRWLRP